MKAKIIQTLSSIIDPEVGFDILSLGLIYNIDLKGSICSIEMTLSTKSCPMHELIISWVQNALNSIEGISEVKIKLVFNPPWSIKMASDEVKTALRI